MVRPTTETTFGIGYWIWYKAMIGRLFVGMHSIAFISTQFIEKL